MITVRVAFGEQQSKFVEEKDPEGFNTDLLFEKIPVWEDFLFNTEKEAEAFKLGINQSIGWLDVYMIEV